MIMELIKDTITVILSSSSNQYEHGHIYDNPIIGISSGADPLYLSMKSDIGDFYWTPEEAFSIAYPNADISASELSVISWILPFTSDVKESQYNNMHYPSKNWAHGKIDGEKLNNEIRDSIVKRLSTYGYQVIAPCILEQWDNHKSDKYGYASNWSERHTAYISGLGTFGLCDGLITEKGKAHRCGSVIVKAILPITDRDYTYYNEYCLYYKNKSCLKCIERCPVGAITEHGHDKLLCRKYQREVTREYIKTNYELESSCCGLCQTDVPCESGRP